MSNIFEIRQGDIYNNELYEDVYSVADIFKKLTPKTVEDFAEYFVFMMFFVFSILIITTRFTCKKRYSKEE